MRIPKILCSLILVILTNHSQALELPSPPKGFVWVEASEIKGAFLKPTNWYFKKYKQGTTQGYFITKENIEKKGYFITGASINVIPNIPSKTNMSPTNYAKAFIREASESRQVIKKPWRRSMGPFNSYGVVLKNSDPKRGDYNTHNLVISNDATGTAYLVIYESPTTNWKESWKIGKIILGKLYIDSDI